MDPPSMARICVREPLTPQVNRALTSPMGFVSGWPSSHEAERYRLVLTDIGPRGVRPEPA